MITHIEANKRYQIAYDFNDDDGERWIHGTALSMDDEIVLFRIQDGAIVELERTRINDERVVPIFEAIARY